MNSYYTKLRSQVPVEPAGISRDASTSSVQIATSEITYATGEEVESDPLSLSTTQRIITGIPIPAGHSGGGGTLDLDALSAWMKRHPSGIPLAVQKEAGHHTGDLSSAIKLVMNDHQFWLFLSCDEPHWLVRMCLIEKSTFILFQGKGRSKENHSLTIGDVVWEGRRIRSLVDVGPVPLEHGSPFYNVFWSWWLNK